MQKQNKTHKQRLSSNICIAARRGMKPPLCLMGLQREEPGSNTCTVQRKDSGIRVKQRLLEPDGPECKPAATTDGGAGLLWDSASESSFINEDDVTYLGLNRPRQGAAFIKGPVSINYGYACVGAIKS